MDVVTGIVVAAVTALLVIGAGVAVGFVVLFRRRTAGGQPSTAPRGSPAFGFGSATLAELTARAGSSLVRTDDAVRNADHELGFAIAQFGAERSRAFAEAIPVARSKLTEAFRLRSLLDDSTPDSERHQREWTLQIIALCDQAEAILSGQDAAFADLRRREVGASGALVELRARIAAATERVTSTRLTLAGLEARYATGALAGVRTNVSRAEAALAEATSIADAAEPRVTDTGVGDVTDALQSSAQAAARAEQLLDAVDRADGDLGTAASALVALRDSARSDLDEARRQRDAAPDAETGQAIIEAMTAVEGAIALGSGPADPVSELDRIGAAVDRLDLALASARNQTDRLAHARSAYAGTLVSATSQIAVVRGLIGERRGGVSARTALAEAERQFALAQAETDPVAALDTIRRAVTLARDADALARFDG